MTNFVNLQSWLWADYDELESTNDTALDLSSKPLPSSKVVITAKKQTHGRGRRGRTWIGLDGNLFMSMLFKWPQSESGALVLITSLALLNTTLTFSPHAEVKLKWPNDVLLNDRKMSGILLEYGQNDNIVVGIGVNIKTAPVDNNMLYPPTSLFANGIICERLEFLKQYLTEFDKLQSLYAQKGLEVIVQSWRQNAKGIGERIVVSTQNGNEYGIFNDIDKEGLLSLATADGKIKTISAGDVFFDYKGEDDRL